MTSDKSGIVHREIMLPDGAPGHLSNRERLWNDAEASEHRKNAQLTREVEFSIPREMTQAQGVALAQHFMRAEFVDRGMIADLNVYWTSLRTSWRSRTPMSCLPCGR